ncbi:hypothetical protein GCM10011344_32210 [Dokdonia pacifica]|uniref:Uncharacterized protein n=1 Tax=Dokdonia pacifica TaxID=1627892 RepID=A0A239BKE0_9FLAO|nr:hypothetical protein [Dokdonia pacifica]GGG28928.1 hypothetical protein GCM10011344_32210 [Dokdonia pacifica]SNS08336.1 hypothetical protein SAMN06265376_106246 [Dokdonia pacifica]
MKQTRNILKTYFEKGDRPTQQEFEDLIDSMILNEDLMAGVSFIDNLDSDSTEEGLTARQGKILKGFIDNLTSILNSNDTTLDELQEIVDFIKQNKDDLSNLTIDNIIGLQEALDASSGGGDVSLDDSVDTVYDPSSFTGQEGNTTLALTNRLGAQERFSQILFANGSAKQSISRIVSIYETTTRNRLAFIVENVGVVQALVLKGNAADFAVPINVATVNVSNGINVRNAVPFINFFGEDSDELDGDEIGKLYFESSTSQDYHLQGEVGRITVEVDGDATFTGRNTTNGSRLVFRVKNMGDGVIEGLRINKKGVNIPKALNYKNLQKFTNDNEAIQNSLLDGDVYINSNTGAVRVVGVSSITTARRQAFSSNNTLTGAIDGSNISFNTPEKFMPNSAEVFLNGIGLSVIDDYTEEGDNSISFIEPPLVGDKIIVRYTAEQ